MGFMGCGKSTIGRALSDKLHIDLLDTDVLIENAQGMSISEIFAQYGEDYFRNLEYKTLEGLSQEQEMKIISLGGGTPIKVENHSLIKDLGTVVYLKATPETIYNRTKYNPNRPLLQCDNPMERIEQMLAFRNPIYESLADVIINVDGLEVSQVLEGVLQEVKA